MPEQEKEQLDSVVSFGLYRLDGGTGQLWRGKQEVKVTPKAFTALSYFVEHPGQLVTKDDLFAAVWPQTIVTEATLASCIQELRSALRDDARAPRYIETVHRRGFRFIAAVTAAPVPSSELRVPSQDEDKQKPVLSPSTTLRVNSVEEATGNSSLESRVQGREAKTAEGSSPPEQTPDISSGQTLDAKPQPSDVAPLPAQRSWSVRSLMVMGLVLLVGIILTVQYLSRSTLGTRNLELGTQPAPQVLALPDKPSIIVLPFTNLSGDSGQEYFSDGITEVLTSTLSRISSLFVIARHSAFTYKGQGVKVQEVSREMGVRYVVEGSVLKTETHIRIMAQLIDATIGYSLWSERYERPLKDIFAVQDEIVQKIVTTLELQLPLREQGYRYIVHKTTDNLEAYDSFLRGMAAYFRHTRETNLQARQMFESAITLDPQFARTYVALGWTYFAAWFFRWDPDPQNLERAFAQAQLALSRDNSLSVAHSLLGYVYAQKKQYAQALAEMEQAIALNPNEGEAYAQQVEVLTFAGRPEQALQAAEHAMRLNPRYPHYLATLGGVYYWLGRYTEAVSTLKNLLVRNPNWPSAYPMLSVSYVSQWRSQQSQDPQTLTQAVEVAQRAVALNESFGFAHLSLGLSYLFQRQHDQAIVELEQVIALDPSSADGYAGLALALSYAGKADEALQMVEEALRRQPSVVDGHLGPIGSAYYFAGKPAEAIAPLKQYLSRYPNMLPAHLTLTAAYSELGQIAEARAAAAEVLRINPKFSLEVHKQREPIKDPAMVERHIAALRKAGLK